MLRNKYVRGKLFYMLSREWHMYIYISFLADPTDEQVHSLFILAYLLKTKNPNIHFGRVKQIKKRREWISTYLVMYLSKIE